MYRNSTVRFAHARRAPHEKAVQGGLSLTPSEMMDLATQGKPIAAGMQSQGTFDNTAQGDFYVPLEHVRGVDITDLYEARMEGKRKFRKAVSDYRTAAAAAAKTE